MFFLAQPQSNKWDPLLVGNLPFGASTSSQGSGAIDLLFDSPITTYIAASLHYLEAVPSIHYLKDDPPHGVYYI